MQSNTKVSFILANINLLHLKSSYLLHSYILSAFLLKFQNSSQSPIFRRFLMLWKLSPPADDSATFCEYTHLPNHVFNTFMSSLWILHCSTGSYASLEGQIFCKPHFLQLFKQKGMLDFVFLYCGCCFEQTHRLVVFILTLTCY